MIGQKFNMLEVIGYNGKNKNRHHTWLCKCDCGNETIVEQGHLKTGNTKSCGCYRPKGYKHKPRGRCLRKLKAYSSWCEAKKRCHNPNHKKYKDYGAKGIFMSEEFINDSIAWCEYLGEPPDDGQRWSVDRIDGNKGYERGNIRWATPEMQARNLKMPKSNTSGKVGVRWKRRDGVVYAAAAFWYVDGKQITKQFNIKDYESAEEAFVAASEYRDKMIAELNSNGAGYSEFHGQR